MSEYRREIARIVGTAALAIGLGFAGLIWLAVLTSWKVAAALVLVLWGNNIEIAPKGRRP